MHTTGRDVVGMRRQNRLFKSVKGSFGETINVTRYLLHPLAKYLKET